MLVQKCGVIYLRDKMTEAPSGSAENQNGKDHVNVDWDTQVSSVIKMRIEDCSFSKSYPQDCTQKIEDEISKRIKKRLVECEGGSWPYPWCEKYFLGEHFVINHVQKKHANKVADTRRKVINNMMMDSYLPIFFILYFSNKSICLKMVKKIFGFFIQKSGVFL